MMRSFAPRAWIAALTAAILGVAPLAAQDTPARPQEIPSLGSWLCLFGSPVLPGRAAPATSQRAAASERTGEEESEDGIDQMLARDLIGMFGQLWSAGEYRQATDVAKQANRLAPQNADAKHAMSVVSVLKALQANACTSDKCCDAAKECTGNGCTKATASQPKHGSFQIGVGFSPLTIDIRATVTQAGIKAAYDAVCGAPPCCEKTAAAAKSCCAENKCCGTCKACAKAGCTDKACSKNCPCCAEAKPKDCACPREGKTTPKATTVRGGCCEGEECPFNLAEGLRLFNLGQLQAGQLRALASSGCTGSVNGGSCIPAPMPLASTGGLRIQIPPMPRVEVTPMPRMILGGAHPPVGAFDRMTVVAPAMPGLQGVAFVAPPMPIPPVHMTQTANHTHVVGATFDAFCRKATMLPGVPCVMLEGDVQMTSKRNGQQIRVDGQRIIVNLNDGSFTAESDPSGVVGQAAFPRRMPMGPIAPAVGTTANSSPIRQAIWVERIEECEDGSRNCELPRHPDAGAERVSERVDKHLGRYQLLGPAHGD